MSEHGSLRWREPDRMMAALTRSPLGTLPDRALKGLLHASRSVAFAEGDVLLSEGDPGSSCFVVVDGTLEASTLEGGERVPLGSFGQGDLVGELAILTDEPLRRATVIALEAGSAVEIAAGSLNQALASSPSLGAELRTAADELLAARLIRGAAPFAGLAPLARNTLVRKVRRWDVEAGEDVVKAGDPSDACFILRDGIVEVLPAGDLRDGVRPATLGRGSLFGEIGVLTGEPRTATVRAREPCRLLVLDRDPVLEVLHEDPAAMRVTIELLRLRERPERRNAVEAHDRTTDAGEDFTVLKDPERGRYFRLSPLGRFVWDRLDGTRNIRDLALGYHHEIGGFAPQQITDLVAALAASGFAIVHEAPSAVGLDPRDNDRWLSLADRAKRALTWHVDIRGVDRALATIFRWVRPLYSRAGLTVLAVLAVSGLVAFLWPLIGDADPLPSGSGALWFLIPAIAVDLVVHELGHAVTVKSVGRDVHRAGVGWFWVGPMAFVDVSDTWLASRKERLAVALGGPYASAILAGLAGLAGLAAPPVLAGALWVFALTSYVGIFRNLNPLIELDGYYALVHLLDRPNLRPRALAWLRDHGFEAIAHPTRIRGHAFEAAYAVASIIYLVLSAVFIVVVYRAVLLDVLEGPLSHAAAVAVGWVLAAAFVIVTLTAVVGDIRTAGRSPHKNGSGARR